MLRDLASLAEADRHQAWADGLAELLVEAKNAVDAAIADGHDGLDRAQLQRFRSAYTKLVNQGRRCVRPGHRSGSVDRDAHNLLNRFDAQLLPGLGQHQPRRAARVQRVRPSMSEERWVRRLDWGRPRTKDLADR